LREISLSELPFRTIPSDISGYKILIKRGDLASPVLWDRFEIEKICLKSENISR
jgi:hypothetical protein